MWRKKIALLTAALTGPCLLSAPVLAQTSDLSSPSSDGVAQPSTGPDSTTPPPPAVIETRPATPNVVVTNTTYEQGSHYYGVFGSGLTLLLATYAATAIANGVINNDTCNATAVPSGSASSLGCRTATWPLYVPVAGPWIQMGYLNGDNVTNGRLLLALDGLSQASGLVMLIAGAAARHPTTRQKNRVEVSPMSMLMGGGLMASGKF